MVRKCVFFCSCINVGRGGVRAHIPGPACPSGCTQTLYQSVVRRCRAQAPRRACGVCMRRVKRWMHNRACGCVQVACANHNLKTTEAGISSPNDIIGGHRGQPWGYAQGQFAVVMVGCRVLHAYLRCVLSSHIYGNKTCPGCAMRAWFDLWEIFSRNMTLHTVQGDFYGLFAAGRVRMCPTTE
jgi:hypothetical protein